MLISIIFFYLAPIRGVKRDVHHILGRARKLHVCMQNCLSAYPN